MKRTLTATCICLVSFSAFSANSSQVSAMKWDGAYAGIALGAVSQSTDPVHGQTFQNFETDKNVWDGGIFAGYNFQFEEKYLVGVELEANLGKNSSASHPVSGLGNPFEQKVELDNVARARVRLGYAVNRMLFYGARGVHKGSQSSTRSEYCDS